MSYLDVPRLHFSGAFFADPSTPNNKASNYAVVTDKGWNEKGTHWFYLDNCTVRRVVDASGSAKTTAGADPLVGGSVTMTGDPAIAKLVDLDPDWQFSSQIWGAKVRVELGAGSGQVEGTMKTAHLRDLWFGRVPSAPGPPGAGGVYQSVLRDVRWTGGSTSTVFAQLKAASPTTVSIKLAVYAYEIDDAAARFRFGKVVGTIGPARADEPAHFVVGPVLDAGGSNAVGKVPGKIDAARGRLIIDLGNALPEASRGGERVDLGTMSVSIVRTPPQAPQPIAGTIDYSRAHYEETAGIEEIPLTAAEVSSLTTERVGIIVTKPAPRLLMADFRRVQPTEMVARLEPGEGVDFEFVALEFGKPKAGQTIGLTMMSPPPGAPSTGALTFPGNVTTDSKGRAKARFTATNPGNPRGSIDGQVYGIGYHWGAAAPSNLQGSVHVLVYDEFTPPAAPKWADVQPIFAQYARLYRFMTDLLNLSDPAIVRGNLDRIKRVLTYHETDPRHMPVTRDLSKKKRQMIIRWINAGAP